MGEEIPFEALRAFSSDAEEWTGVYQGKRLIGIENGDTRAHQYGVAVDIGTTTMVLSLVDLQTGRLLESAKELNPQIPFGQEVIARIAYVVKHGKQGLLEEQAAVIKVICQMIQEVFQKTQVPSEFICEVSVAGNPTMTHLLLGVDPRTIGRSPYVLTLQKGKSIPCSVVGLNGLSPFAQLAALPTVSSYIGSDILGGIYARQIYKFPGKSLFIDIGTNGEIVLGDRGHLYACSAPAGPALEGMMIHSGMKASQGAIEEIHIGEEGLDLSVIGGGEPLGICGSGILAAIREFVDQEWINQRGRLVDPTSLEATDQRKHYIFEKEGKRYVRLINDIIITQKDIRHVQLAKAAIFAGIQVLLEKTGYEAADLDEVVVAGQFGSHISEESLLLTGLFPHEFQGKIRYVGNASHSGAYLNLISSQARKEMVQIAKGVDYTELSVLKRFERLFAKASRFKKGG